MSCGEGLAERGRVMEERAGLVWPDRRGATSPATRRRASHSRWPTRRRAREYAARMALASPLHLVRPSVTMGTGSPVHSDQSKSSHLACRSAGAPKPKALTARPLAAPSASAGGTSMQTRCSRHCGVHLTRGVLLRSPSAVCHRSRGTFHAT